MDKIWLKCAATRALKTVCQTAIATIGTAAVLSEVNWLAVASASVLAGIISILTSLAGLPEVDFYHAQHSAQISQDQEEPEEQGTVHVDAEDIR